MATSIALNYALNNGMTQAQYDKNIFDAVVAAQKNNTSPALLRIEMDRLGVSSEDVARATGVTTQSVQEKYTAALPTTRAELIADAAADAELAARTGRDTTASAATIAAAQQTAGVSQGLLASDTERITAANAAIALAATQKAAADKAAADAAAIAASNATAAQKAAAAKAAADAKAVSDAAAAKIAADAKAVSDAAAAKAAANAKAVSDAAAAKAAAAKTVTTTATRSPAYAYALANGMTEQQYYKNIFDFYSKNSGKSDSILRSEMDRLQISPQDVAAATGVTMDSVLSRYNNATATTAEELTAKANAIADLAARQRADQTTKNAFANATDGFAQNLANYQSIPIGAQFNPGVTVGGASPYSQVMGQMQPFQNPYANFVPGTALGGYNPNLYNDIAKSNADAAAKAAAAVQAANNALLLTGSTGPGDATGDAAAGTAAATAAANAANAAAAVTGESVSVSGETGESVSGIYNRGGIVDGLFGMNPPGPDDGAGYLDRGEYVIKKSSVKKYGRGLLDMINEGKVPAKKIRSLLD